MKIPDRIRIGGVEYDVKLVENLRTDRSILYGMIDYEASEISISTTDCKGHQMKCICLLHEILHGIVEHAGLDVKNADEEQVVETMSKGLYAVLQDNGGRLFDLKEE